MITKLILKISSNYKGKLQFMGEDCSELPASLIRERVFYLDFECGVFAGTLGENLFPEDEEILTGMLEIEVVNLLQSFGFASEKFSNEKLGMWIDPSKLDSTEKLIIGLTRCVLECKHSTFPPSLILLDNIDSRFSVETYSRMKTLIDRELKEFTIIMICSVPKVAKLMQECVVLRSPKVVEVGPVNELEKNPNSEYSKLVKDDILSR